LEGPVVPENNNAGDARGTSGIATSFHQGYESTQPPEPLLNALLHNDCTGKVPVDKLMHSFQRRKPALLNP